MSTYKKIFLFFLWIVFGNVSSLFAMNHFLGTSLLFGNHFRYGGDYATANVPYGIWALNSGTSTTEQVSFTEPSGISIELDLKYIYKNKFFLTLGGMYTYGGGSTGTYPLRDPSDNSIYLLNGTTEVKTKGTTSLRHYGIPLSMGFVMNYWNEVRIFLGGGASYVWADFNFSQRTGDKDILDFNVTTSIKPNFLTYHALIMAEAIIIGNPQDQSRIAVNAGIKIIRGMSDSTADTTVETNLPTTVPTFPLQAQDAAKVDVSGYRVFFGITYYFMRR